MKRFTETSKWRDPWFRGLSGHAKLLWLYITDNCDNVGLLELNLEFASLDTGLTLTSKHLSEIGTRVQVLEGGRVFIPKFINFQYGELSPLSPPHKKLLRAVEQLGLTKAGSHFQHPQSALPVPLGYPKARVSNTLQEEEEDKEEEKGIQRGSSVKNSTVLPLVLAGNQRFVELWTKWLEHLGQKKKPPTLHAQDLQLARCEEWGLDRAIKAIEASIEHNWQSIYEEKHETHQRNHTKSTHTDRSAGTLNAGRASDYANVGKLVPIPNRERPATGKDGCGDKAV